MPETPDSHDTSKMGASPSSPTSGGAVPPRIRIKPADKKSETARIDLAQAQVPTATESITPRTMTEAELAELYKKSTIRIDDAAIAAAQAQRAAPPSAVVRPAPTAPVSPLSETRRVDEPAPVATKKSETAHLDVPSAPPAPIAPIEVPAGEEEPRTPTVALRRPKTIQMRPIGSRPTVVKASPVVVAAAAAGGEAKKSETARLDLPSSAGDEQPSARPKTIRIKRPDGTSGRKPLVISRPDEATEPLADVGMTELGGEAPPSAIWAVAALIAVLVTMALIYVLLAQGIAPTLPMPGRLV